MTDEVHISSLIIHAHPSFVDTISARIELIPELEVAASDMASGKVIAVMETTCSNDINSNINTIRDMDGVLNVAMVFHQVESSQSLKGDIA